MRALMVAGASLFLVTVLFLSFLPATVLFLILAPLMRPEAAVAVPPMTMNRARAAMTVAGRNFLMVLIAFFMVISIRLVCVRFYGDNDRTRNYLRGSGKTFQTSLFMAL